MTKPSFQRLYRETMNRNLEPLGFLRKEQFYWRQKEGLLHLVSLDRSSFNGAFTVDIAVQPLAFPAEYAILGLGARLDRFAPDIPARWEVPVEEAEIRRVLDQFASLVVRYAVPWLDRFQSCQDIVEISVRNDWRVFSCGKDGGAVLVALCALDAGLFEQGRQRVQQLLMNYYGMTNTASPEWMQKQKRMFEELEELLDRGDFAAVRERLDGYKAHTRAALGIGN